MVGLGDKVSPTDIEEGMRVGYVPDLSFLVLPSFASEISLYLVMLPDNGIGLNLLMEQ